MTTIPMTFGATFSHLEAQFARLQHMDRLQVPVRFALAGYMARKRVTIKALAAQMGISQDRVRQVRAMDVVPFLTAWDFALGVLTASLAAQIRGRR